MKLIARLFVGLAICLAVSAPASVFAQGRNEISGSVFGESGRPVPDIYVELLTDMGSTKNRVRTDSSGRFAFGGLTNGRYRVRVLPSGTGFSEQTQELTLFGMSAAGADRQEIQFYLTLDQRAKSGPFALETGVVFAQEVPREAQKLYDEGIKLLAEKKEAEGLNSLKKSIELFPNYYLALDRLGSEYAVRGISDRRYLEAGFVLLTKASEVNPKGFSSAFGLGWVQYQLGLTPEAIENLRRATTLYGNAADAYLWLGIALRRSFALDQAEVALKRANELMKGKSADVHWQLAGVYNDQKRYKEAANEFELFLKVQPESTDAEKIRKLIKQLREKDDSNQSRKQ
jgi:tetratricopeptide (TPR) repeat protein